MLGIYDPKDVTVILGSVIVNGFADGTFVSAAMREDAFTLAVGADGDAGRAKSNDRSGAVTFTLLQTAKANALLTALHVADLASSNGAGVVPLLIRDNQGNTLVTAQKAWIKRHPTTEFGKEISNREWEIETDSLVIFNGGN